MLVEMPSSGRRPAGGPRRGGVWDTTAVLVPPSAPPRARRNAAEEAERTPAERNRVGAKHLLHAQLRLQGRELPRDLMEAGAPSRDRGAIDRPRRGAGDDGEGGRTVAKCRDLTDPLEHP